jgi:oligosaccharide repeat unit polymerase
MSLFLPFLISLITFVYFTGAGILNFPYLLLSMINSFITASVMFSREDRAFTLAKIVNLFIYVFFVVANGIQLAQHSKVLTFFCPFTTSDFVFFQLLVLCILVVFNVTYHFSLVRDERRLSQVRYVRQKPFIIHRRRLIYLALFCCLVFFAYMRFNVMRMLFRGMADGYGDVDDGGVQVSQMTNLIMDKITRSAAFSCFVIAVLNKNKVRRSTLNMLFCLTLFSVFPSALSRNAAAMYWLPIVALLFGRKLRKHMFMWFMVIALFVLFPFFNLFRNYSGSLEFHWSLDFLSDMNFDASQIFMATVKTDFITYGHQLLGPLLFFVPRSWWPDKPVGSGHELVTTHHGFFANVSMPYFAEGYVNFGFIGILLFTLFLGYLYGKLDAIYWNKWKQQRSFKCAYYLILLGATVFIMRGDLLSSFAYTVGIMLSYTMCLWFCTSFKLTNLRWK